MTGTSVFSSMVPILALLLLTASLQPTPAAGRFEVLSTTTLSIPWMSWLSPDGKWLLYLDMGPSDLRTARTKGLYLRPFDSSQAKRFEIDLDADPVWSPDSRAVYFLRKGDHAWTNDLWRLDVESGKKALLVKDAGGVSVPPPAPSPDGKWIAFFRGPALMTAAVDGRGERKVCDHCEAMWWNILWSPDSSQILFFPPPNPYLTGVTNFSLITVATGQVTKLAPWKGVALRAVWPGWGGGLFVCVEGTTVRKSILSYTYVGAESELWHVALPDMTRTRMTHGSTDCSVLQSAGPESGSLMARRSLPPPTTWDGALYVLGMRPLPAPVNVMLKLKRSR